MSHILRVGVADQIAYFRAYNTDGAAKTDLTSSTTGLTLSVFRVGASSVSISSLSNKAADDTAHADGAIRNVGGNLYTIDLPDAACATQCPSICVRGSYTGGVIEGLEHPIVAYDPSVVAVGANTTTPPTATQNAAATLGALLVDYTSTGSFGAAIGALSASSGSGARTVTVTVNDGTTALQNARVRMTEGANTYVALTNASGVVTFNLNDATYTVGITKDGYSYSGTTLVVDGNETVTYSMTAISITPSNPSLVTGYYTCYSELGVVESGVTVTLQVDRVPSETGLALDSAVRTATSDSNGLAQFTNLVPGAWYKVRRGEGNYYTFQISATATGSVELNSIIGT